MRLGGPGAEGSTKIKLLEGPGLASRCVLERRVWLRGASWRAEFGLEVRLGGLGLA